MTDVWGYIQPAEATQKTSSVTPFTLNRDDTSSGRLQLQDSLASAVLNF